MKHLKSNIYVSLMSLVVSVGAMAEDTYSKISQGIEEEINNTNIYRAYYPSKELARKVGCEKHYKNGFVLFKIAFSK